MKLDNVIREPVLNCVQKAFSIIELAKTGHYLNIPYIIGNPGIGKTSILKQIIEKKNKKENDDTYYGMFAITPALVRYEWFTGVPDKKWENNELHTQWSIPEFVSKIRALANKYKWAYIILDDMHLSDASRQQIFFELTSWRSLSGHSIPDNAYFILAGNATSAAGARLQNTAIINRCRYIYAMADTDQWLKNYVLPRGGIHPYIVEFFSQEGNKQYLESPEDSNRNYATPRSWESFGNELKLYKNHDERMLAMMLQGLVDEKAQTAFLNFFNIRKELSIEKFFKEYNNMEIVLPSNAMTTYIYTISIAVEFFYRFISGKNTKEYITKFSKLLDVMANNNKDIVFSILSTLSSIQYTDKKGSVYTGTKIIRKMIVDNYLNDDLCEILKGIQSTVDENILEI